MKICPQCNNVFEDTFRMCPHDGAVLAGMAASSSDPMIGTQLAGRFLLVDKLGQGGMGTVYKALHTQMDRTCAIKVLSPSTGDTESAVARFKREARMASRIDNPHAVLIYDFGQAEGGLLYLAMEYIDGSALTRLVAEESPLAVERVVEITDQIAEALEAAHALGIIHRDLKPDNIMITSKSGQSDYVKVLDFGIAKTVTDDEAENVTKTGFVLGTPVYMSPEQLSGEKLDPRSDLYSLGIIVYEMLSKRLPFQGDNPQAVMFKRVMGDPMPLSEALPGVSEAVERVVMAALARNREDRTPTVKAFASALGAAARTNTKAIAGRVTDNIGDKGTARDTTPASYDRTVIAGSPDQGEARIEGAGLALPSGPEKPSLPPPPAFITQPSGPSPAVDPVAFEQPQTRAQAIPPTAQVSASPPTRQHPIESQSPSQALRSVQAQFTAKPQPTSRAFTIISLSLAAVLISAGGIGYLLISRNAQGPTQVATAPPPRQASPPSPGGSAEPPAPAQPSATIVPPQPGGDAADADYTNGKKHQEQAYLLANAGSKAESIEESKKAIAEYREAIRKRPLFPEAHENLAVALYNSGQIQAALDEYRTAIKQYEQVYKQPTAQVYTNYGLALFDLKRYREAADQFTRAIELDPTDHDLYALLGYALQNGGDKAGAKTAYEKYLSLEPTGQYADTVRKVLEGRATPPTDSGNQ